MDLMINLLLRENSLSQSILFCIKNPSLLRPWIPVVKIISPGLHAFLRNSSSPWIPNAVIEMIFSFPFEHKTLLFLGKFEVLTENFGIKENERENKFYANTLFGIFRGFLSFSSFY